jgi:hypothetical protein
VTDDNDLQNQFKALLHSRSDVTADEVIARTALATSSRARTAKSRGIATRRFGLSGRSAVAWTFGVILLIVAVTLGTSALTTSGKGSKRPTSVPPPTSSNQSVPTTTTRSTTETSTSTTSVRPSTVGVRTCTATDLGASVNTGVGAGGFTGQTMVLTNHSTKACSMDGYPGVELLGSGGNVISNAARGCVYLQGCSTAFTKVVVQPGGSAYFVFVWRDNPQGPAQTSCPESATALVTPPNAYDHLTVQLHIAPCGIPPVFGVGTVQAGTDITTTVNVFNPWTPERTLYPQFKVLGHLSGGSCFVGSMPDASIADPSNEYAWRCNTERGILDPCFAPRGKTDVTELACVAAPYLGFGVYLLELSQPLAKSSTGFTPKGVWPLVLELSNGDQCSVIQGTSSAPFFFNYGCNHGTASEPTTAHEPWTVSYLPNGAHAPVTVPVTSAWE